MMSSVVTSIAVIVPGLLLPSYLVLPSFLSFTILFCSSNNMTCTSSWGCCFLTFFLFGEIPNTTLALLPFDPEVIALPVAPIEPARAHAGARRLLPFRQKGGASSHFVVHEIMFLKSVNS